VPGLIPTVPGSSGFRSPGSLVRRQPPPESPASEQPEGWTSGEWGRFGFRLFLELLVDILFLLDGLDPLICRRRCCLHRAQGGGPVNHRNRDREGERRGRCRRGFRDAGLREIRDRWGLSLRDLDRGRGMGGISLSGKSGRSGSSGAGVTTAGGSTTGISLSETSGMSTGITSTSRPAAGSPGSCTGILATI